MDKKQVLKIGLWIVGCSLLFLLGLDEVWGSDVLSKATEGANKLHSMIAGPLGKAVLVGGTLIGAWKAFQTGNILLVAVILLIGMGLSWQIEAVSKVFG